MATPPRLQRRPDRVGVGHDPVTVASAPASLPGTPRPWTTIVLLRPPSEPLGDAPDLATALARAQQALGHRPLLTVHTAARREEQSATSLAQWAAKGAHLLGLDLLVGPGDRLVLDAPLRWPAVAVLLAAWWAGVEVALGPPPASDPGAEVAVLAPGREPPPGTTEVLVLGDGPDGAPTQPAGHEAWTQACQAFPDQPPPPLATGTSPALDVAGSRLTQAGLLARAAGLGTTGSFGVALAPDGRTPRGWDTIDARIDAVVAAAVRPLISGRPTLLLHAGDRGDVAGERIVHWYPPAADSPTPAPPGPA